MIKSRNELLSLKSKRRCNVEWKTLKPRTKTLRERTEITSANIIMLLRVKVSKETVVLRRLGYQGNLVISTKLKM